MNTKPDLASTEKLKTKTLIMVMPKRKPIQTIFVMKTDGHMLQEHGPNQENKAIVTGTKQMKIKKMP